MMFGASANGSSRTHTDTDTAAISFHNGFGVPTQVVHPRDAMVRHAYHRCLAIRRAQKRNHYQRRCRTTATAAAADATTANKAAAATCCCNLVHRSPEETPYSTLTFLGPSSERVAALNHSNAGGSQISLRVDILRPTVTHHNHNSSSSSDNDNSSALIHSIHVRPFSLYSSLHPSYYYSSSTSTTSAFSRSSAATTTSLYNNFNGYHLQSLYDGQRLVLGLPCGQFQVYHTETSQQSQSLFMNRSHPHPHSHPSYASRRTGWMRMIRSSQRLSRRFAPGADWSLTDQLLGLATTSTTTVTKQRRIPPPTGWEEIPGWNRPQKNVVSYDHEENHTENEEEEEHSSRAIVVQSGHGWDFWEHSSSSILAAHVSQDYVGIQLLETRVAPRYRPCPSHILVFGDRSSSSRSNKHSLLSTQQSLQHPTAVAFCGQGRLLATAHCHPHTAVIAIWDVRRTTHPVWSGSDASFFKFFSLPSFPRDVAHFMDTSSSSLCRPQYHDLGSSSPCFFSPVESWSEDIRMMGSEAAAVDNSTVIDMVENNDPSSSSSTIGHVNRRKEKSDVKESEGAHVRGSTRRHWFPTSSNRVSTSSSSSRATTTTTTTTTTTAVALPAYRLFHPRKEEGHPRHDRGSAAAQHDHDDGGDDDETPTHDDDETTHNATATTQLVGLSVAERAVLRYKLLPPSYYYDPPPRWPRSNPTTGTLLPKKSSKKYAVQAQALHPTLGYGLQVVTHKQQQNNYNNNNSAVGEDDIIDDVPRLSWIDIEEQAALLDDTEIPLHHHHHLRDAKRLRTSHTMPHPNPNPGSSTISLSNLEDRYGCVASVTCLAMSHNDGQVVMGTREGDIYVLS